MKTIICQTCGKPFEVKPYRASVAKYCSSACKGKAMLGSEPANKGVFTRRVTLICAHCGKTFEREAGRLNHGRGKHCSPECQYAAIKARPPKAPTQEFTCLNCGKQFWIYKSVLNRSKGIGKYCCRACRDEHWLGENTPLFIHGKGVNWHGPNWYSQRRKARRRDKYLCQHCGLSDRECVKETGQPLHVHHIVPFRVFGDDYEAANHLRNLITLCPACHRIADSEYQRTHDRA